MIVADHDPLARSAVCSDMAVRSEIEVVGEGVDTATTISLAIREEPDVVLLDADLPPDGGIAAAMQLHEIDPSLHVVLFSVRDEDEFALASLDAGLDGFLNKDIGMSALARALTGVATGEAAITRRLTLHVIDQLRTATAQLRHARPVRSPLTERQWETIDLLADGWTEREIAAHLGVSIATVRSHVRMVRRSLGARTVADAVQRAERLRTGLPFGKPTARPGAG